MYKDRTELEIGGVGKFLAGVVALCFLSIGLSVMGCAGKRVEVKIEPIKVADALASVQEAIAIPALPKEAPKRTSRGADYHVVKGDCLWNIAGSMPVYGDSWLWPMIYRANRDSIVDPDKLEIGQQLIIPARGNARKEEQARKEAQRAKWPKN